jgi:hypothetical protein
MAAFIECTCGGGYIPSKGMLTTYAVPFIDGAMRRYLESSMGTLAIDRGSMTLVRKAQELYHVQRMTVDEIASELDIPLWLAAKHIKYATHFLSVYDLAHHDDDDDSGDYGDDVYDYIAEQTTLSRLTQLSAKSFGMSTCRGCSKSCPRRSRTFSASATACSATRGSRWTRSPCITS